jgi:hypothetical protein
MKIVGEDMKHIKFLANPRNGQFMFQREVTY